LNNDLFISKLFSNCFKIKLIDMLLQYIGQGAIDGSN